MFNMGFTELLLLAVIGLVVLGPEQLPVVARKIARLINEFKRTTNDVLNPVENAKKNAHAYLNKQIDLSKPAQSKDTQESQPELPKGDHNE